MSTNPVHTIKLPSGEEIPVLGQGTWGMGEDARRFEDEVAALHLSEEDLAALDRAFPPPTRPRPLEML